MRNFKKFLTLVLAVMMVVSAMSFTTSAAVTKFEDVDADNEVLVEAVDLLSYMGITKGVSDTQFGADQDVTREQFALFMYRLMKGGKDAPKNASNTTAFTDLSDPTYNYAISWAFSEGIVNGKSDTSFAPKDGITLQEAYTMVVRALDYEEEEKLLFPHGYIEVAEKLGVELDNGLDSDLSYEDKLTRADMAIILYNAFFAETGVAEVKTKERGLGWDEDSETYTNYVLEEYTTYPRLCEKAFEVVEVEYAVAATPHFQLNGGADATYDLGYEALYVEKTDADINDEAQDAPGAAYLTAEDLGVAEGTLDAYFLGEFTMFVTLDDDDEIEKVLFADCNMVEKTVDELKFGTVSSNKTTSYFESEGTRTDAKLLSGKITTGTETIYAFNAPYSYIKPSYVLGSDAEDQYVKRNENNIGTISFARSEEDDEVIYTATIVENAFDLGYDADGLYTEAAENLVDVFAQAYYGGLYEADLYDVNGDGVYEYIQYKPYLLFQVDADEDYSFVDGDTDWTGTVEGVTVPYVYTNEAVVSGVEFEDEDYVIGYFSEEAGVVHVAAVLEPTVTTVDDIDGTEYIFADGSKADSAAAWKMLANYAPEAVVYDVAKADRDAAENVDYAVLDEDEKEYYVYDGVVYLGGDVNTKLKFNDNIIIPLDIKAPRSSFNSAAGEDLYYIYAWVDGEMKYVAIDNEDVYPSLVVNDEFDADAYADYYANQLCSYTVNSDGVYTITSLMFNEDEEGDADNMETDFAELEDTDDDKIQVIGSAADVTLTKVTGTRYDIGLDATVNLKSFTKILVLESKEKTNGDVEYTMSVLDASDITDTATDAFDYATYVVANNTASKTREDLVVLFGIMPLNVDFEFEGKVEKNGQRIVSLVKTGTDDEGQYRNYYDLINPFTGKKETKVPGTEDYNKASQVEDFFVAGDIVELKGGEVDEDAETVGKVFDGTDTGLVYIAEYDAAENYIVAVPVSEVEYDCADCFDEALENYVYEGGVENFDGEEFVTPEGFTSGSLFYEITDDTAITVVKYTSKSANADLAKWGTVSAGDVSIIANPKNEYKCYNSDYTKEEGSNITTKYSKYLKAYISASQAADEEETPVADYIIIVVTDGEDRAQFDTYNMIHSDVE